MVRALPIELVCKIIDTTYGSFHSDHVWSCLQTLIETVMFMFKSNLGTYHSFTV